MRRLVRIAEAQGFKVKATKAGWMVYAKENELGIVTIHGTPSVQGVVRQVERDLKSIGVEL